MSALQSLFARTSDKDKAVANPAAVNAAAASFAALIAKLDYLNPEGLAQVRRAYKYADEAHLGQLRNNGEPYITHPIAVAAQCADWKLDAQALSAALLHDAMEDCGITKVDLIERFGIQVADLVDGLTKLDKLEFNTREENQAWFSSRVLNSSLSSLVRPSTKSATWMPKRSIKSTLVMPQSSIASCSKAAESACASNFQSAHWAATAMGWVI